MELNGKVALVTGASSGIGAATAIALAKAGVKVGLAARRADRLARFADEIRGSGGQALAIEMDVVDASSVGTGVQKLVETFGAVDIVVNNAGLMPISDVAALKTDEWNRMIDVNLKGVLNTTAATLPILLEKKAGHIVNISSIAGRKVFAGLSVYCATKFAVAALSDGMRMELGPKHGIRVTCVQPGAVESELFEQISDVQYRKEMEGLKSQMTFLKSKDVADTILFALQAPPHVNVGELFVLPSNQAW